MSQTTYISDHNKCEVNNENTSKQMKTAKDDDHHDHHHHIGHHHHHQPDSFGKAFAIGIILNVSFVVIEAIYGFLANSSALLADAGHNASDVLSLFFAWAAIGLATKKTKDQFTYGYKKTTILVSVFNALLLFFAIAIIAWEAVNKLLHPEHTGGDQVMIVAGIGIVVNTITALMFLKGSKKDLNIKGAFLHMAADAIVSLGVVISGFLILKTGLQWIDSIMSFIIIGVIFWSTLKLFTDSLTMALDGTPKHINIEKVRHSLLSQLGVDDIHDLHIWAMSTTQIALTAHIILREEPKENFISEIQETLEHQFGIVHSTLQLETEIVHRKCKIVC